MSAIATLKNGYPFPINENVFYQLEDLQENHIEVFLTLVQKCRDPSDPLLSGVSLNPKDVLIDLRWMSKDGTVRRDIQEIVLNNISGSGWNVKFTNPLNRDRVSLVHKCKPIKEPTCCHIL